MLDHLIAWLSFITTFPAFQSCGFYCQEIVGSGMHINNPFYLGKEKEMGIKEVKVCS